MSELNNNTEELEKYTKTLSEKELEIEGKKQIVENNTNKKYELVGNLNTEKAKNSEYKITFDLEQNTYQPKNKKYWESYE